MPGGKGNPGLAPGDAEVQVRGRERRRGVD